MCAGLKSNIEISPINRFAGILDGVDFGMVPAEAAVEALPYYSAVAHQDCAYERIGTGSARTLGGKLKSSLHVSSINHKKIPEAIFGAV
jgi:hypothetical protein